MDVDHYVRLSKQQHCLLQTVESGAGRVEIHEHDGMRWVYTGNDAILSMMRVSTPAEPVMPNHHAMLGALLFCTTPDTALNLGTGTGVFERFFSTRLPDCRVTSVDADDTISTIAHRHFKLPDSAHIEHSTAQDYLAACDEHFDLVFCDVFESDRHPSCINESGFYHRISTALHADGILSINLSPASERELLEILLAIRASLPHVVLVNLEHYGNLVLYAARTPFVPAEQLAVIARERQARLDLSLEPLIRQMNWLPLPA